MRRTQAEIGAEIDSFLSGRRTDLVDLVCRLVSIDSQIPPFADERAIVGYLSDHLAELGLGAGEVIARNADRPNLLLRIPGAGGGPTLMLNGHLDTKPVGDARAEWRTDPLVPTISDGRLHGLGASDMKAAVAAMVYAALSLQEAGIGLKGDLVLAFVADEEAGAAFGSRYLADRLPWQVDACLIGEPTGWSRDWQGLHLVSRGLCCFRVQVTGTQAHSSLSDRMPSVNANLTMAELMLGLSKLRFDVEPHRYGGTAPTLNVGVLARGGVYFGVIPGHAEFGCDLRTIPGMSEDFVHATLDRWLADARSADAGLDAVIGYEPGLEWIPASEIPVEHPLVLAARACAGEVLDAEPPLSVFPGTTDAPWYAMAGIPTLPALGPGILTHCHGPNEFVSLRSVDEAARMYARIATRYCGVAG